MYKYIITLLVLVTTSCCEIHTEITYNFKGTTIKRIDECGKSIFYYNNVDKETCKIWVKYSGINDGFSGYLKFKDNGKVLLLSGDGYFQSANIDTSKFEYKRIIATQRPTLGKSVYYITLSTRYEKESNLDTGTDVKVEYNNGDNK